MFANKVLLVFIVFDFIFLLSAALHLFIPLYTQQSIRTNDNINTVAQNLLLDNCPLTASMVNSILMMITFAISLPALFRPRNIRLLQVSAWGIIFSAILTLVIGLLIWYDTLETHKNHLPMFNVQPDSVKSLLQQKFNCCGYDNPGLFVRDDTCTSSATAARLGGCMIPFGTFANRFLDVVFTTFFAFVAVDMITLLSCLCVIKDRKERARYRLIDEKRGFRGI